MDDIKMTPERLAILRRFGDSDVQELCAEIDVLNKQIAELQWRIDKMRKALWDDLTCRNVLDGPVVCGMPYAYVLCEDCLQRVDEQTIEQMVELEERIKDLECSLHDAIIREREAEKRADASEVIVLPVEDGLPGEVDMFSDGHSHHYVPTSLLVWEDAADEWTEDIKAAHPTRSNSHEEYATAMKMVGNRHSKGELVALANWLLVRIKEAK